MEITLPAARGCPLANPRISPTPPPIRSRCLTQLVHKLPPLRLRQVAGSAHCWRWNETIAGDRYLGYTPLVGSQSRTFVFAAYRLAQC